ncbi:MAG: transglycosylase SLT domain-containing protein [Candidatus Handelsmanbacteria bacterium]|nr:transglycosylase SLT domain-containing protein [Candidatus Handelsmanbacteria bacterium]
MKRTWTMAAGLWCLLPAMTLAAEADSTLFPRPHALRGAIEFWKQVFGVYTTRHVLIHDDTDLSIIYGVERLERPSTKGQRQQAQEQIMARYRRALEKMEANPADTTRLSSEERLVWLALGRSPDPARYARAAEALRVQVGQRDRFFQGLEMWDRHGDEIRRILRSHGVPDSLAVLPFIESGYNPDAYSHVGAAGLWQIMKATGRPFLRIDRRVDERRDPFKATAAAAQILKGNLKSLGAWPLAITAYNHGAAGVARGVREVGSRRIEDLVARYKGPAFGFASRNFYAEFAAVLELIAQRPRYFGAEALAAAVADEDEPVLAAGFLPPLAEADSSAAAAVSMFDNLIHRILGVRKEVNAFTTVNAQQLPPEQTAAIKSIFQVAPEDTLQSFRWGPCLAPKGHPHQGTLWYTLWYEGGEGPIRETLRLTPEGEILEKTRRE